MKRYILFFVLVLVTAAIYANQMFMPDLIVEKIEKPRWDSKNKQTIIEVIIKNRGKRNSKGTRAILYDYDPKPKDLNRKGLSKKEKEILKGEIEKEKGGKERDPYVRDVRKVPPINWNKKAKVTFYIKDHWIYDPNCEIEVFVDFINNVKEKNEENNRLLFLERG